jgi:hypothetical protein
MHALPVPSAVEADPKSRELIRVWAAGGKQHVTLATGLWDDPAAWGIALVDLAKHVANAYELDGKFKSTDALARISAGFRAEWEHATDEPFGELFDEQ